MRYVKRSIFVACVLAIWFATQFGEVLDKGPKPKPVPFLQARTQWVDSLMASMTTDEKIGQLLMVVTDADSITQADEVQRLGLLTQWIKKYRIGAIAYRNYSIEQQVKRTQIYQKLSPVPLLIGNFSDASSEELLQFPKDIELATIQDRDVISDLVKAVDYQANALGAQVYFQRHTFFQPNFVEKASALANSFQENHIIPCIQYADFPRFQRQDTVKWDSMMFPLQKIAQEGISAIMLDTFLLEKNRLISTDPQTATLKSSLRSDFQFEGLVFAQLPDEIIADIDVYYQFRKMFRSDVDMILVKDQVPQAMAVIKEMLRKNILSYRKLDQKVRKILLAKVWAKKANRYRKQTITEVQESLKGNTLWMNQKLGLSTSTLVQDSAENIPIHVDKNKNIHLVHVGQELLQDFSSMLDRYCAYSDEFFKRDTARGFSPLNHRIYRRYSHIIIALDHVELDPKKDSLFVESLGRIAEKTSLTLIYFGDLDKLPLVSRKVSLLHVPDSEPMYQRIAVQILFGGMSVKGRLPKEIKSYYASGQGKDTEKVRLAYSFPESVGLRSERLGLIDSIVAEGIRDRAFPGCQVLVARKGNIIFQKAYGHHTYGRRRTVKETDVFDIASITKVAATTMAVMQLKEQGKINLNDRLSRYFQNRKVWVDEPIIMDSVLGSQSIEMDTLSLEDYLASKQHEPVDQGSIQDASLGISLPGDDGLVYLNDSTVVIPRVKTRRVQKNAALFNVRIADLLTHHSGLPAALPILEYVKPTPSSYKKYFSHVEDEPFDTRMARDFYLRKGYLDSIWEATKRVKVYNNEIYEYSDVNMVVLEKLVDSLTQKPFHSWIQENLYRPMGLQTIGFLPLERMSERRIVPTENDRRWRKQLLRGHVHDQTAALMGGVSGNAGIFSNANDLAALMQLLLNNGTYGGKQFFHPNTVAEFTSRKKGHRAYGFDMPPNYGSYIGSTKASDNTYGHTGFSGTCVWVDPDEELIFVFLSNRIYPSARNWRLNELKIRERIHDLVYFAMEEVNEV